MEDVGTVVVVVVVVVVVMRGEATPVCGVGLGDGVRVVLVKMG